MQGSFFWIFGLAVWALCAGVAAAVAPDGRRGEFAVLTFLFLGPLGVGFASVASQRQESIPEGRRAIACPRCAARQYVDPEDASFECWRCSQISGAVAAEDRVQVIAGGDERQGRIGVIHALGDEDDDGDVLVRFDGESNAYMYDYGELKRI